ncbi:MAG TPA: hypothetical protein VF155_03560 [Candidatus Dormibacteraeota bacterium]
MLLDATGVLLGIGLAVAGFAVVVLVTALVLRLIGVVLGDDDAGDTGDAGDGAQSESDPG